MQVLKSTELSRILSVSVFVCLFVSLYAVCVSSSRVASMLTGPCGLSRGDHVVVLLPKLPQWWLLNIACARAGSTAITSLDRIASSASDADYCYTCRMFRGLCVCVSVFLCVGHSDSGELQKRLS